MTFYKLICELSKVHMPLKHGGFTDGLHFDQGNKRITVGKDVIYDKGIICKEIVTKYGDVINTDGMKLIDDYGDPYAKLEQLFYEYTTSIPNQYSSFLKNNFIAKEINNVSRNEFKEGISRQIARIKLEAFVMFTEFPWENEKHHYWQSKTHKTLVLYRNWASIN